MLVKGRPPKHRRAADDHGVGGAITENKDGGVNARRTRRAASSAARAAR